MSRYPLITTGFMFHSSANLASSLSVHGKLDPFFGVISTGSFVRLDNLIGKVEMIVSLKV